MEKNGGCRSALFGALFYALAGYAVSVNVGVSLETPGVDFGIGTSQVPGVPQGLTEGFYSSSCPDAEFAVFEVVKNAFINNPAVAPGLIRIHFHDCFVRGCDGSVLIDSIGKNVAEKDSPANNPSLHGFDVIDMAKAKLEAMCPQTVSCADILAFAARDSAKLASPPQYPLSWDVAAGRRDGNISLASDIPANLPPPTFNVTQLTQRFAAKGLSQDEMVILSGAHTIGVSHCSSFVSRLYNFNSTHPTDPSLDPVYAMQLKARCPNGNPNNKTTVPMEVNTPNILDNLYYDGVIKNRGLFTSDATLLTNANTRKLVFANSGTFSMCTWQQNFAAAMVKMGKIEVLTGNQGEIRVNCRVVNK